MMKEPEEWLGGDARCSFCGKEWIAVAPAWNETPLECPRCHTQNGTFVEAHFCDAPKKLKVVRGGKVK